MKVEFEWNNRQEISDAKIVKEVEKFVEVKN